MSCGRPLSLLDADPARLSRLKSQLSNLKHASFRFGERRKQLIHKTYPREPTTTPGLSSFADATLTMAETLILDPHEPSGFRPAGGHGGGGIEILDPLEVGNYNDNDHVDTRASLSLIHI